MKNIIENDPFDVKNVLNINKIAESIEKAEVVLKRVQKSGNIEAIATWTQILAALNWRWREAMVVMQTNGRYSFQ